MTDLICFVLDKFWTRYRIASLQTLETGERAPRWTGSSPVVPRICSCQELLIIERRKKSGQSSHDVSLVALVNSDNCKRLSQNIMDRKRGIKCKVKHTPKASRLIFTRVHMSHLPKNRKCVAQLRQHHALCGTQKCTAKTRSAEQRHAHLMRQACSPRRLKMKV